MRRRAQQRSYESRSSNSLSYMAGATVQRRATVAQLVLAAFPAILVACASTAETRFVVIESESYGCGAVEGLGCGLAIAPVLDTMDQLEGVAESSVSWDGKHFRIEVLPGADSDQVAAAATALLEGQACCVAEPRGQAQVAAPDQWFNSEQTLALSRHEAEVLAADFATEVAAEVALSTEASARLHVVLHEELEHAFERAHAAGGGVHRLWEQLPQTRATFESRLAFLTQDERARVMASLDSRLVP